MNRRGFIKALMYGGLALAMPVPMALTKNTIATIRARGIQAGDIFTISGVSDKFVITSVPDDWRFKFEMIG